ncbi:MAG: AAA family ATPase [Oscillospiraceae bacterium]|nr:AAA family ATPase [Oscillospiraceae bacterium]
MVEKLDPMTPQVAVLGSLFIEPKLTGEVLSKLRAEDFSNERCRIIFQCIQSLFMEGKPVDPALVAGRLSSIPDIGSTIMDILHQTPTAANVWSYVDILKEQSRMTQLRTYAMRLMDAASLDEAQSILSKANGVFSDRTGVSRMSAAAMLTDFRERHQAGKHPEYLSWSFKKLDEGLYTEPGDFVILGGYPSAGKTALALRFAWHIAETKRVGFYSLETRTSKLADRSMATLAMVDMGAIKKSELTQDHWLQIGAAEKSIAARNMTMVQAGGMTVQDIQADALANRYEVIFIDYLQLIATPRVTNRTEAVTSISLGLHQLAQANNITVVALSQLRRPENQKGGAEAAPGMSSLRESGQLEQDADTIMLLYREKPDEPQSRRVLKMAKNKEGTIGKIFLDFDGKTQTFTESSSSHEVMRELQAAGRQAKRKNHMEAQATFRDITNESDEDLPF